MAALSANNPQETDNPGIIIEFPVKGSNTHIYQGARVCVASGYLVPGADSSGLRYVGVALDECNNTGSDGDMICRVQVAGNDLQTIAIASAATQATVGVEVFLADDQTVDIAANSTNKVAFGTVIKFLSAGWVIVDTRARFTRASAA